ncbi:MAG: alpha-D-ribose 1-methylphosphonate 5-triphosphate diphosphatase [Pseudomonadota bacterium]
MTEVILGNASVVLRDEVVQGTVVIRDGLIAAIDQGSAHANVDLEGDYLLPGLVDVHTDHLEKQSMPRGGVFWNAVNAARTHDMIVCLGGTTTVFDSLVVGAVGNPDRLALLPHMLGGIAAAREAGLLKVDHLLHLRCDLREGELTEQLAPHLDDKTLRFVTAMDDGPNRDPDRYRRNKFRKGIATDVVEAEIAAAAAKGSETEQANRNRLVSLCRELGVPLASHDDTRQWHIDEAVRFGMTLSEFPITLESGRAAKAAGLSVIAGSPNVVLGRSHGTNVSVRDLAAEGLVDVLCSDYVPASMLHAVWQLTQPPLDMSLPEATAMASARPAELFGLSDRGEIALGKRADLIRVREHDGKPVVHNVWVGGARVV